MRVLTADGALVMPWRGTDGRFWFARLGTRDGRVIVGPRARVEERETSCAALALFDAPDMAADARAFVAQVFLEDLAWLQGVPVGATVKLGRKGLMRCEAAADRAWLERDSMAWAARQRAQGFLPVLVDLEDGTFRVIAMGGLLSIAVVDLGALLLTVRRYSPSAIGVEVL